MQQIISVWIINLKKRPDRMLSLGKQLDGMGVSWKRVEAVDGKTCSENILNISSKNGYIGKLSNSTRGCTASHYKVWNIIKSDINDFGIVLEDDVVLSQDFKELVFNASWIPKQSFLIKLEKFGLSRPSKILVGKSLSSICNGSRSVHRMFSRHGGAAAYLLSREGASIVINSMKPYNVPVDHLLFNETVSKICSKLKPLVLIPAVAYQSDDFDLKSDITNDNTHKKSKLRRKILSIKRGFFEIRLLPYQILMVVFGTAKIVEFNHK